MGSRSRMGAVIRMGALTGMGALNGTGALINKDTLEGVRLFERGCLSEGGR